MPSWHSCQKAFRHMYRMRGTVSSGSRVACQGSLDLQESFVGIVIFEALLLRTDVKHSIDLSSLNLHASSWVLWVPLTLRMDIAKHVKHSEHQVHVRWILCDVCFFKSLPATATARFSFIFPPGLKVCGHAWTHGWLHFGTNQT